MWAKRGPVVDNWLTCRAAVETEARSASGWRWHDLCAQAKQHFPRGYVVNRLSYLAGLAVGTASLIASAACSAAPTSTNPTVGAAATAVSTAAQPAASAAAAAASPVASAAAAAASPVATQAAASASPAATSVAAAASPAATTAAASSPVRISGVQVSPTDSTITVQNASGSAVSLAGWKLQVGTASATLPSSANVPANDSVTIHTASGTNSAKDIYLGQDATALIGGLTPGARVALLDAQSNAVTEFRLPG
jgi:hypothetical protein